MEAVKKSILRDADVRAGVNRVVLAASRSLPVCTKLRTSHRTAISDAMCQQETRAPQQTMELFDHLIGSGKQCGWNAKPECFGSFQVDDELEFRWLLDRQISRSRAF